MSKETDRIAAELLTDWVDSRKEAYDQLARPYREAAELRRRLSIAALVVDDMPCQCRTVELHGGAQLEYECFKHTLDRVLRGDE